MKLNAKRIVSMVLCLVMVLSLMTVAASALTQVEIVEAAYALEKDTAMSGTYTLEGKITKIDTPYDTSYKNISVTIAVAGIEDKPILCYRLKGTGCDSLAIGDTITVTGVLKNYKGTVEFDAKCNLDKVVKGDGPVIVAPTDPLEIVAAAYALAEGESLPYNAELTGKITKVNTAYDPTYKNVTVTIQVSGAEDKPIECYRLKGTGAEELTVGDTITVYGVLKNHYGKIEFNAPSLKAVVPGPNRINLPEVPEQIAAVEAAYALAEDAAMAAPTTLTGMVIGVVTPFDPRYNNVTILMEVPGTTDMPIQCYRMVGEGADLVAIGDAVTVTGLLKNYKGTVQFDSGCTLDSLTKGPNMPPVAPEDPVKIVEAAYKLSKGSSLPYIATLTGEVTEIQDAYSEQYGNITVVIEVPGTTEQPIICYRLKGEGAESIAVGDTITVMGIIKNYYGKIEFDTGCTLVVDEEPAAFNVSGTITASKKTTGDITVELWAEGAAEAAYTVTTTDGAYTIEAVAPGTYTVKVSKAGHVTGEFTVTVEAEDVTLDATIYLIGDVTGDGNVNILDVSKIYTHVKGGAKLSGDALTRADITGDTRVNILDVSKIYAHVKGTSKLF